MRVFWMEVTDLISTAMLLTRYYAIQGDQSGDPRKKILALTLLFQGRFIQTGNT